LSRHYRINFCKHGSTVVIELVEESPYWQSGTSFLPRGYVFLKAHWPKFYKGCRVDISVKIGSLL